MTNQIEQRVQTRVTQALNDELLPLDELTQAKLTAARLNALAQAKQKPWWRRLSLSQGVLATSFSLFMVFVLVQPTGGKRADFESTEMQLLAAMNPILSEDVEMLEQLEFVAWLEQESLLEAGHDS